MLLVYNENRNSSGASIKLQFRFATFPFYSRIVTPICLHNSPTSCFRSTNVRIGVYLLTTGTGLVPCFGFEVRFCTATNPSASVAGRPTRLA